MISNDCATKSRNKQKSPQISKRIPTVVIKKGQFEGFFVVGKLVKFMGILATPPKATPPEIRPY